jgi:hypothetical protein
MELLHMSMTFIDAINEVVETVMEFPMSSLKARPSLQNPVDTTSIYARAEQFITRENLRVQSTGWPENTDLVRRFVPVSSRVDVPQHIIRIRGAGPDAHRMLVIRAESVSPTVNERRVYDANRQTFVISEPIYLDAVNLLDFELLPRTLQDVIVSAAKLRFEARMQGSQMANQQLTMEYMQSEFIADRNRIRQDAVPFNPRPPIPGGGDGGKETE